MVQQQNHVGVIEYYTIVYVMCAHRWLVKENEWNKMHRASIFKLQLRLIQGYS